MSCDVMRCHVTTGLETVGIFRRAAGKSRVEVLKGLMETNPGEETGAYPHGGRKRVMFPAFFLHVY